MGISVGLMGIYGDLMGVAWDPSISRNIEMADVLTTNKTNLKIPSNRNYLTPPTR